MFDKKQRLSMSQTGKFETKNGSSTESILYKATPATVKKQTKGKFVTIVDNKSLNSDIRHSFDANAISQEQEV